MTILNFTEKFFSAKKCRRLFILLVGAALVFAGCRDEALTNHEQTSVPESLRLPAPESARQWYEGQQDGGAVFVDGGNLRSSSRTNLLFHGSPTWNFYCVTETAHTIAVDVDMTDCIGLDFVTPEGLEAFEQTSDWNHRHSHTRLVVLTSRINGRQTGFLMTVVPSPIYTEHYRDRIRRITYLQRDPDFDGMILFHHTNGAFSNGWVYEHGRITTVVSPGEKPNADARPMELSVLPASYTVTLKTTPARLRSGSNEDDVAYEITLPEVVITPNNPPTTSPVAPPYWGTPGFGDGGYTGWNPPFPGSGGGGGSGGSGSGSGGGSGSSGGGSSALTPNLNIPYGNDFYEKRIEDFERRYPGKIPPSYYEEYAEFYMNEFENKTAQRLSDAGKIWIAETKELLQKEINKMLREKADIELNEGAFLDKAFASHVEAYTKAGILTLSVEDKLYILTTVYPKDLLSPLGRRQALEVTGRQIGYYIENPKFALDQARELQRLHADGIIWAEIMQWARKKRSGTRSAGDAYTAYECMEAYNLLIRPYADYFRDTFGIEMEIPQFDQR